MRLHEIVVCSLLLTIASCSQQRISGTPEQRIIRQLAHSWVVMVGDFAHEFPLPYHGLIQTLSTWLTMVEKGESDQYQVTLFLEEDRQTTDLLRQYLKTGDWNPLLDFLLPYTSIERLEFYSDLRSTVTRIDSLNSTRPASQRIAFDIQGPEALNIFSGSLIDSSQRAARLYYVRDRDSLTADNAIAYLHQHPDTKGLFFFGNGHLIKNLVRKDFSPDLSPEENSGWFLGYYLKRALGEDQVFTISQIGRTRSRLRLDAFTGRDVMLFSGEAPWKDSEGDDEDVKPSNFDAFIVRDGFIVPGHPLRYVFSKRIVRAAINRLEFAEKHRSGAMGTRLYQESAAALAFLCDTSFSTAAGWKSWCATRPFDGLRRLQSDDFRKRCFDLSSRVLGTREFGTYIDEFINLGFDPRVGKPTMTREEWDRYLVSQWPQIVCLNAIGLLWIGDSEERADARKYLRIWAGEDTAQPDQLIKLWRKRFYGVIY